MKETLEFLRTELRMNIATFCRHLRNKAYPVESDALQSALSNIVYYQLMEDELGLILNHHRNVIEGIQLYLTGEPLELGAESIHQYCQKYFEGVDCPLGSSSEELKRWVSMHADRQQITREGFEKYFPNIEFLFSGEVGESDMKQLTDAELFNIKAREFLRDIEDSNALEEFNQRMRFAHEMLKVESSIADILAIIEGTQPVM